MTTLGTLKVCALLLLTVLLGACASAPLYPPQWATTNAPPRAVANAPERYQGAEVIWGGRIIAVRNLADHTEIEIFAYPLDDAQAPRVKRRGGGRFIALLHGYVEPLDYPAGALVTLRGRIVGVRSGTVGQAPYPFPLVDVTAAHIWSQQELRDRHSRVNFSVGIGIGL